jgi:hypothetical protein
LKVHFSSRILLYKNIPVFVISSRLEHSGK